MRGFFLCALRGIVLIAACLFATAACAEDIDFSRDILPLLSDKCFACHGPDENVREAGLRLDKEESAFAELESGSFAIVKSDRKKSELWARVNSDDDDLLMPPPDAGKSLTKDDIATLGRWIDSGAKWSKHWAFVPAQKTAAPEVAQDVANAERNADEKWTVKNPIDQFIQRRVADAGMQPEARADKETLLRRATLDLIGLPPTIAEIDSFLEDEKPGAYERLLDRLLHSRKYGEHMARAWLDAARYADTHGLHLDNERQIWPYRDWVIEAYNRNMPFDDFTVEQLAGDLLPQPSLSQKIATGFNRCNVTTGEGGSIDDEYYVRYAVDRVETTSTVWLGLTAGCAACHDHKFDPLSQKEFYQLFSYFFSLTEKAMDGNVLLPPPAIKAPTTEQAAELKKLEDEIAGFQSDVDASVDEFASSYSDPNPTGKLGELAEEAIVWIEDALPEGATPSGNEGDKSWTFVEQPDHPVFSGKTSSKRSAKGLTQHFFDNAKVTFPVAKDDRLFAYVYLDPKDPPETVQLQFNDGSWEHRAYWGADKGHAPGRKNHTNLRIGDLPETGKWVRLEVAADKVGFEKGAKLKGWAFTQFSGTVYWDKAGRTTRSGLSKEQKRSLAIWQQYYAKVKPSVPDDVKKVLEIESDKRDADQVKRLEQYYYRNVNPDLAEAIQPQKEKQSETKQKRDELNKQIPSSLVMEDRKEKRQAHVLDRGEYTKPQEKVSSRIPEWISPPMDEMDENRLGLAQWLVKEDHPLTARVTVNRIWQHFFGIGLVRTAEDFGVQGERPTHPELLDWLAVDFVESGWNVKRLQKMIMMSATYQQSSIVSPDEYALDPENRLLARGPRFRLDAEIIRDQALAVSGLLVPKIGGASVKPYQPAGLWKPVGFGGSNTSVFKQDHGDKLYRRSMYTFWKRTSPPPSMSMFDAPDRETCRVRRSRTNTPLQALVLMNDVQFVESARKLAERILLEGGDDVESKIRFAFRSVVTRQPSDSEVANLKRVYEESLQSFEEESAEAFLKAGESPRNEELEVKEVAAWTMVSHLILNLSEAVTRG